MNSDRPTATERSDESNTVRGDRRRFLAIGAGIGATLLAGCSAGSGTAGSVDESPTDTSTEPATAGDTATVGGTFRLLVSDQPVAIDEFDSLEVTLDRARIFRDGGDGTATPTGNETAAGNATATPTATATPASDGDESEGSGFSVVDIDGATVDLTRVVGDKAITVFDGELEAGRYTKIELHAADVAGVVDGESVDVTIPSGKLQLTKPFEVTADDPVDFVFDINVVRRGGSGEYNLLPVISESGVAGRDVDVTEIGDRTGGGEGETGDGSAGTGSDGAAEAGGPDDSTPTGTGEES
jgi:hypothetical protein